MRQVTSERRIAIDRVVALLVSSWPFVGHIRELCLNGVSHLEDTIRR